MSENAGVVVWAEPLKDFCTRVLIKLDVPPEDAAVTADSLVTFWQSRSRISARGCSSSWMCRQKTRQ
jgi:LDH2 family malate/lactate/ureidoglycolate dehydrogenase